MFQNFSWRRWITAACIQRQLTVFTKGAKRRKSAVPRLERLEPRCLLTTIDLASLGSAGTTIFGADAGDLGGLSVSSAGDVNGDGFDDMLFGARRGDASGNSKLNAGESYVVFGGASLPATVDLANLGSAGITIFGTDVVDYSGRSVSAAGDVNGDGFDDLLIGAYGGNGAGNGRYNSGESYVIFGGASLPTTIDLASLGSAGITIFGVDTYDYSGKSVSSAGDVNGDGFDDLLIGAYKADALGNSKTSAGDSYVIFGGASLPATIDLASLGSAGITIFGTDAGDFSSRSVSSAGDVNGDGFDDLLIGADTADASGNGKSNAGDSYVIFGGASLPTTIDLASLGSAGITIFGANAGDQSGFSVRSAGDVNGDGFDDMLIGAWKANSTAGRSYVIFGGTSLPTTIDLASLGAAGITIFGAEAGDQSGVSVSRAGDVNGDGFDDLLIGAGTADAFGNGKPNAGDSYLIFGGASLPTTISLASLGSAGITIFGADANDYSSNVNSAGDVNGDGFDDLLIGGRGGDASGNSKTDAGENYVIFGGDFTLAVTHAGTVASETLTGNASANVMIGGRGNDTLIGNGGADVLRGGEGNDVLAISDLTFKRIVGGNGDDTLRLDGSGLTLNLTTLADNKLTEIEEIDIRGSGANTLTLNLQEVLNLTSASNPLHTANTLRVRRGSDDSVNIGGGWTQGADVVLSGVSYQVVTQGVAVLQIERIPGFTIVQSGGTTSVSESGTTDSFTVVLTAQPLTDVVISVSSGDTSEATVSSATLTFTNANWNIAQTVTVAGVNDSLHDGHKSSTVTLSVDDALSDDSFDPVSDQAVSVTTLDDDPLKFSLTFATGSVSESGGAAVTTATLSRNEEDLSQAVTVKLTSSDVSELSVPSTVVIPANSASVTFPVDAVDDFLIDGVQTVTVSASEVASASADTSFGTNGLVTTTLRYSFDPQWFDMALQPDGKIVAIGEDPAADDSWNIVRLNADGSFDSTFGTNGVVVTSFGSAVPSPSAVEIMSDGRFVVLGGDRLVRYLPTGGLDTTFDGDGQMTLPQGMYDILVNADGSIWTCSVSPTAVSGYPLTKVNANGSLGTTTHVNVDNAGVEFELGSQIIRQSDGKFLVAGSTASGVFATRFFSDGTVDASYGTGGNAFNGIAGSIRAYDVAIQPDGRLVVASRISVPSDRGLVVRFNTDGTPDTTFTASGRVVLQTSAQDSVTHVDVLEDGNLLLLGRVSVPGKGYDRAIFRLNADGSFNTNFDGDGVQTLASLPSFFEIITTGLVQPDGKLVTFSEYTSNFRIERFDNLGRSTAATINVTDNDVVGFTVTQSGGSTLVSEAGSSDTFTVVLTAQPLTNVVISVISGDTGEATVSPATLTFTPANWNVAQTVTVTGVDDPTVDGTLTTTVTLSIVDANSDDAFDLVVDQTVSVTTTDNDTAGITIVQSGGTTSVSESGTTDSFTVVLTAQPQTDVVISVASGDTGEATVGAATLTFTSANWNTAQTVTVTGVDDPTVDGSQTTTVTLSIVDASSDNAFDPVADQTVSVTTTDNDSAGFTIVESGGTTSVSESGTTDRFTVVLTAQPLGNVVLTIISGDATEAAVSPTTLTFTPANWNAAQTVTVTGMDDFLDDGDQTTTLTIVVDAANSRDEFDFVPAQALAVTTADDDSTGFTVLENMLFAIGPWPQDSVSNPPMGLYKVDPTTGSATLIGDTNVAQLQGITPGPSGNFLATNGPTLFSIDRTTGTTIPVANLPFGSVEGDLALRPGTNTVYIVQGEAIPPEGLYQFNLTTGTGGFVGAFGLGGGHDVSAAAFDPQGVLHILYSDRSIGADLLMATVDLNTGVATNILNTMVPNSGVAGMAFNGLGTGFLTNGTDLYSFDLGSGATSHIGPNGTGGRFAGLALTQEPTTGASKMVSESGTTAIFSVALSAQPTSDVTILLTSGDNGEAVVSPSQLTFTSTNWNVPQTITITGVDDFVVDGDQTTAITLSIDAANSDDAFDSVANQTVNVTTTDNDAAGFAIVQSGGTTSVSESGTTDSFTVVLSAQPLTDVVISVTSGDTGEATVSASTLTFTSSNWNTAQTVTVTGVDDPTVDGSQTTTVTLSIVDASSDNAFDPVVDQTVSVTTTDNDAAGFAIVQSGGTTSVSESGTTDSFTVVLSAQPLTNVVISVICGDTGEATVSPATLTFTPANWNVAQTITVTGIDDTLNDGNQTTTVTLSVLDNGSDDLFDSVADQTVSVTTIDVNHRPTISDITNQTIDEDSSLSLLTFVVSDVEIPASSLTVTATSSNTILVPYGNIVFGGSGTNRTVTLTPATNQSGSTTISVYVSDGLQTTADTFVLTVNSINDVPTIGNLTGKFTDEEQPINVAVTIGDAETSPDQLMLSATSTNPALVPAANIVFSGTGANRTLTLTPAFNQSGTATIRVTVSDGTLASTSQFLFTVNGINDVPTISDITNQTIDEDSASGALALTIGDVETAVGSLVVSATSSNTTLIPNENLTLAGSGANRTLVVAPATNQFGTATITVTVSDGTTTSNDTFMVTVNSVNDAPSISNLFDQTINRNSSTSLLNFTIGDFESLASDLVVTASSSNTTLIPSGSISLGGHDANRTLQITPTTSLFGSATITVTVSDGNLASSDTFLLTVNENNQAPTINDVADQNTSEDTPLTGIEIIVSDDGTTASDLIVTATSSNITLIPNANLELTGSGGSRFLKLTPAANQSGTSTITLTVSDGRLTRNDTFTLTVNAVNDAPTISAINNQTINEDSVLSGLLFTIDDLETSAASLTVTASSSNQSLIPNSSLIRSGSGANRFLQATPVTDQSGTSTITISVSDGLSTTTREFILTINPVNDLPTLSGFANRTTNEDTPTSSIPVIIGDNETASSDLIVTASSSNTNLVPNGSWTFGGTLSNRTLIVTPATNAFGTTTITVTVADGTASVSKSFVLTVNAVNDAPTLSHTLNQSTDEDQPLVAIPFTIGDAETSASSLTVTVTSSNLTLVPANKLTLGGSGANRTLTVTPTANLSGSTTITVKVSDGTLATTDTFVVTVNAANDAPTISDITNKSTKEDTASAAFPFAIGDIDSPLNSLVVTATSSNGALVPNGNIQLTGTGANRSLKVIPAANQFGTSTISVIVSDGSATKTDTFVLTVTPVNDPPTISNIFNQSTSKNTPTGDIPFTVDDIDTPVTSLKMSATSSNTTLVPNANIVFVGTEANRALKISPAFNKSGTATITVRVTDGFASTTDTFVLTVNNINASRSASLFVAPPTTVPNSLIDIGVSGEAKFESIASTVFSASSTSPYDRLNSNQTANTPSSFLATASLPFQASDLVRILNASPTGFWNSLDLAFGVASDWIDRV